MDWLIQSLKDDGYERGAPNPAIESIDRMIVEGNTVLRAQRCKCGSYLSYLGVIKHSLNSKTYIAFAVCENCGYYRKL